MSDTTVPDGAPETGTDASQAFEELARISLDEHSMTNVLERVAVLAQRVVPGAAEVSVTIVGGSDTGTVVHTGELALRLDEGQYARGYGPCMDAAAGGETLIVEDARTETRWPDYTPLAVEQGSLSSMSVPVPVQRQVSAALNLYAHEAGAFDADSVTLAETFASYAAVAVANMHLYEAQGRLAEQMRAAMTSRAVIEQAKGILMGQRHCTSHEAFDVLVRLSQDSNRKLREVAEQLVYQTGGRA